MEVGCSSLTQSTQDDIEQGRKKNVVKKEKNYASTTTKNTDGSKTDDEEVRLDDLFSNNEASHRSLHIPHRVVRSLNRT